MELPPGLILAFRVAAKKVVENRRGKLLLF